MKFDTAGFRLIRGMYAEGCASLESRRCWACERIAGSEKEAEMAKQGTFEWALGEVRQGVRVAAPLGDLAGTKFALWLEDGKLMCCNISGRGEENNPRQAVLLIEKLLLSRGWEYCPWPAPDAPSAQDAALRNDLAKLASEYDDEAAAVEATPEYARARFLRSVAADLREVLRGGK